MNSIQLLLQSFFDEPWNHSFILRRLDSRSDQFWVEFIQSIWALYDTRMASGDLKEAQESIHCFDQLLKACVSRQSTNDVLLCVEIVSVIFRSLPFMLFEDAPGASLNRMSLYLDWITLLESHARESPNFFKLLTSNHPGFDISLDTLIVIFCSLGFILRKTIIMPQIPSLVYSNLAQNCARKETSLIRVLCKSNPSLTLRPCAPLFSQVLNLLTESHKDQWPIVNVYAVHLFRLMISFSQILLIFTIFVQYLIQPRLKL